MAQQNGLTISKLTPLNSTETTNLWLEVTRMPSGNGKPESFRFPATALKGEKGDKGTDGNDGVDGQDGQDGTDGRNGVDGRDGKSIYELMVAEGRFSGTLAEFLDAYEAGAQSGGNTGGDNAGSGNAGGNTGGGGPTLWFRVKYFSANDWELPEGITVEKIYNNTSLRIKHNLNMYPTGFFGFNRESDPWTVFVQDYVRNMQIEDKNTIIMTGLNGIEDFDFCIRFS